MSNGPPPSTADKAWKTTFLLYEGKVTPHRSCGIALAEAFGLPTRSYQSLRRGGISGAGECGAIKAGELVIGELLGDPDPTGVVTPALRKAILHFQEQARARLVLGAQDEPRRSEAARRSLPLAQVEWDIRCSSLTAPHGEFTGEPRKAFCTALAADVARLVAESLEAAGHTPTVKDPPG